MKRHWLLKEAGSRCLRVAAVLAVAGSLAACSGSGEEAADSGAGDAGETVQQNTDAEVAQQQQPPAGQTAAERFATYDPPYDESAVYSLADIPDQGNYLKLNMTNMSEAQINSAIHKFKTTACPCQGCASYGLNVDRCLAVKPECMQGLQKASEIVIAERALN